MKRQQDQVTEQSLSRRKPSNRVDKELRIMVLIREAHHSNRQDRLKDMPEEYLQYNKLFQEELDTGLPEYSQWDHEIPLQEGIQPKLHKVYRLNPEQ